MSAGCEAKPHNPKRKRAKGFEPSTFGMEGQSELANHLKMPFAAILMRFNIPTPFRLCH